jgi:hypothetical protein
MPFNQLQPKRSVVSGGAIEIHAVQDRDRHGCRTHAPSKPMPYPPGGESWVEAHDRNVARSAGGPQRTRGADEYPWCGSQLRQTTDR